MAGGAGAVIRGAGFKILVRPDPGGQCRPQLAGRARHRAGPREYVAGPEADDPTSDRPKTGQPSARLGFLTVLIEAESSLLQEVARFAATPLAVLVGAIDAGGAARALSRPTQCGAGAGQAVAARNR
jgi:hypothetical protein